jgi:hypothetical protein
LLWVLLVQIGPCRFLCESLWQAGRSSDCSHLLARKGQKKSCHHWILSHPFRSRLDIPQLCGCSASEMFSCFKISLPNESCWEKRGHCLLMKLKFPPPSS